MPLVIVAADVATDGNLLFEMKSYIDTLRANSTSNSTDDNVTEILNSTASSETGNWEAANALVGLWGASGGILAFSMLNLILGNPVKLLIRNVRTSVLMASREMEAKDVPLPIGENPQNYSIQTTASSLIKSTLSNIILPPQLKKRTFQKVDCLLSQTISLATIYLWRRASASPLTNTASNGSSTLPPSPLL